MDTLAALLHMLFAEDLAAHPPPPLQRLFAFFRGRGWQSLPPPTDNTET